MLKCTLGETEERQKLAFKIGVNMLLRDVPETEVATYLNKHMQPDGGTHRWVLSEGILSKGPGGLSPIKLALEAIAKNKTMPLTQSVLVTRGNSKLLGAKVEAGEGHIVNIDGEYVYRADTIEGRKPDQRTWDITKVDGNDISVRLGKTGHVITVNGDSWERSGLTNALHELEKKTTDPALAKAIKELAEVTLWYMQGPLARTNKKVLERHGKSTPLAPEPTVEEIIDDYFQPETKDLDTTALLDLSSPPKDYVDGRTFWTDSDGTRHQLSGLINGERLETISTDKENGYPASSFKRVDGKEEIPSDTTAEPPKPRVTITDLGEEGTEKRTTLEDPSTGITHQTIETFDTEGNPLEKTTVKFTGSGVREVLEYEDFTQATPERREEIIDDIMAAVPGLKTKPPRYMQKLEAKREALETEISEAEPGRFWNLDEFKVALESLEHIPRIPKRLISRLKLLADPVKGPKALSEAIGQSEEMGLDLQKIIKLFSEAQKPRKYKSPEEVGKLLESLPATHGLSPELKRAIKQARTDPVHFKEAIQNGITEGKLSAEAIQQLTHFLKDTRSRSSFHAIDSHLWEDLINNRRPC